MRPFSAVASMLIDRKGSVHLAVSPFVGTLKESDISSKSHEAVRPTPTSNEFDGARSGKYQKPPRRSTEPESQRLGTLGKFEKGRCKVLVATLQAGESSLFEDTTPLLAYHRYLNPVCGDRHNFGIPAHSKDYIRRAGRTTRAVRAEETITSVVQYDVELIQRVEAMTGGRMELWPTDAGGIALLRGCMRETSRLAANELKE